MHIGIYPDQSHWNWLGQPASLRRWESLHCRLPETKWVPQTLDQVSCIMPCPCPVPSPPTAAATSWYRMLPGASYLLASDWLPCYLRLRGLFRKQLYEIEQLFVQSFNQTVGDVNKCLFVHFYNQALSKINHCSSSSFSRYTWRQLEWKLFSLDLLWTSQPPPDTLFLPSEWSDLNNGSKLSWDNAIKTQTIVICW